MTRLGERCFCRHSPGKKHPDLKTGQSWRTRSRRPEYGESPWACPQLRSVRPEHGDWGQRECRILLSFGRSLDGSLGIRGCVAQMLDSSTVEGSFEATFPCGCSECVMVMEGWLPGLWVEPENEPGSQGLSLPTFWTAGLLRPLRLVRQEPMFGERAGRRSISRPSASLSGRSASLNHDGRQTQGQEDGYVSDLPVLNHPVGRPGVLRSARSSVARLPRKGSCGHCRLVRDLGSFGGTRLGSFTALSQGEASKSIFRLFTA